MKSSTSGIVFKLLLLASICHLSLMVISQLSWVILPTFNSVMGNHDSSCYVTDAMIVFVDCGSQVFAGRAKAFFFNYGILNSFIPIFTVPAVVITAWAGWKLLRRRGSED